MHLTSISLFIRPLIIPSLLFQVPISASLRLNNSTISRQTPEIPKTPSMEIQQSLLVLSGKSPIENDLARSFRKTKNLKASDGEEITISLQSEIPESSNQAFRIESYMDALSTDRFGRFLIWSPRLASTHDIVSQNFCELPIGSVCVTDVQFKGRGRSKNVWESPIGCLMFSFTVQMENGRVVPLLQYVVSLAVTEAINMVCEAKGLPHLDVKIKWPNDLYLDGLKVGGILCTSTYRSKKFNVSAGIGLNVDNDKPTTCLNSRLHQLGSAHQLRKEDILAAFFNKFEVLFYAFMDKGFEALEDLYYKTWLHSGQKVVIEEKSEGQSVATTTVTIQGLTSSGYLLAIGADEKPYELHPDGNRQNLKAEQMSAERFKMTWTCNLVLVTVSTFQLWRQEH